VRALRAGIDPSRELWCAWIGDVDAIVAHVKLGT
jgi:hypothetical protein